VRRKTLHKKIGYRNDFGLTFVAVARLEERVDALSAFPSFHNDMLVRKLFGFTRKNIVCSNAAATARVGDSSVPRAR
jgi:hypothetical protein